MRIGITTFGCDRGKSGISRYVAQLLEAIAKVRSHIEYEIITHPEEAFALPAGAGSFRLASSRLIPLHPVLNVLWHQVGLPHWCSRQRYDVLFLPAGNRRVPLRAPCPAVGTVHDLAAMHLPGKYDRSRMFYNKSVLPLLIRRLSIVLTLSESSKQDIVHFCGVPDERIRVIPLGVDHASYYPRPEVEKVEVIARHGLRRPYLVYISRIEHPGKNHIRLIHAFEQLKRSEHLPHQLVLVGSDWSRADLVHQAAECSRFRDDIVFTGVVGGEDLPPLLCGADACIYPSLFEGFGLPILEAMSCGVPVACSNSSSMPEVGGDAVLQFDPDDVCAIREAMGKVVGDEGLRERLSRRGRERARRFTWERTARETIAAIEAAASL